MSADVYYCRQCGYRGTACFTMTIGHRMIAKSCFNCLGQFIKLNVPTLEQVRDVSKYTCYRCAEKEKCGYAWHDKNVMGLCMAVEQEEKGKQ